MSYIPDPTDDTQPADSQPATTAAAEFRSIKTFLKGLLSKAGGILTGNLTLTSTGSAQVAIQPTGGSAGLVIQRATSALQNYLTFASGNLPNQGWQVLQDPNDNNLYIYNNGLGKAWSFNYNTGAFGVAGEVQALRLVTNANTDQTAIFRGPNNPFIEFQNFQGAQIGYLQGVPSAPAVVLSSTLATGKLIFNIKNVVDYYLDGNAFFTPAAGKTVGTAQYPWQDGFFYGTVRAAGFSLGGQTVGTNSVGNRTVSVSAPSAPGGPADLWFQVV